MIRVPHPVYVTQSVTRTRGGQWLILIVVAALVLSAYGLISLTPESLGPKLCQEWRNGHQEFIRENPDACPDATTSTTSPGVVAFDPRYFDEAGNPR